MKKYRGIYYTTNAQYLIFRLVNTAYANGIFKCRH